MTGIKVEMLKQVQHDRLKGGDAETSSAWQV